jgi:hypothetical protein
MAEQSSEFKDRSLRGQMNRFYNFIRQRLSQGASWTKAGFIKGLKAIADSVFKAINSVLGSLGKALGSLAGVGAAIDVIKQIEHLDAASTAVKEHEPSCTVPNNIIDIYNRERKTYIASTCNVFSKNLVLDDSDSYV